MGFLDKIKAAVGVGQPKLEIKLPNTTIYDDALINGWIEITAQKTRAVIDEVKLEFIHKVKAKRVVTKDGVQSEEEFTTEGALYRILFKNNYSKHFEKFYYNGETRLTEKEEGSLDIEPEKNKIIIEPNQTHSIQFQFCLSIFANYASSMPPNNMYYIRATVNMPGLDPKTEVAVNLIRTQ